MVNPMLPSFLPSSPHRAAFACNQKCINNFRQARHAYRKKGKKEKTKPVVRGFHFLAMCREGGREGKKKEGGFCGCVRGESERGKGRRGEREK